MGKDELHQMVDRLPDHAVDGAAILLREVSDGASILSRLGFGRVNGSSASAKPTKTLLSAASHDSTVTRIF